MIIIFSFIKNYKKMNTYTGGFYLKFKKDISKKEYIELCKKISFKLNELYNLNDNSIKILPEAVTEGGMVFEKGNNEYNKGYKTMRHSFSYLRQSNRKNSKWEWITEKTYEIWNESEETLIFAPSECSTYLKAFGEAPAWTLKELQIFKTCFEEYDVKVTKMPKAKDLIHKEYIS
jgi:hypothetical protein